MIDLAGIDALMQPYYASANSKLFAIMQKPRTAQCEWQNRLRVACDLGRFGDSSQTWR